MTQSADSYVRTQATAAAIINVIANPLMAWLTHPARKPTALAGVGVTIIITCLIMSSLISYFLCGSTRRALAEGRIDDDTRGPHPGLAHLPTSWLRLGLVLGAASAVVLVPLAVGLLAAAGVHELPFWGLLVFTFAYTGVVAYVVGTLVVRRQLVAPRRRTGRTSLSPGACD